MVFISGWSEYPPKYFATESTKTTNEFSRMLSLPRVAFGLSVLFMLFMLFVLFVADYG
jgi:hypothetical protein